MIGGLHTVSELRDWLAALDFQIGVINRGFAELDDTWSKRDPDGRADWARDWAALTTRYGVAHGVATSALSIAKTDLQPDWMNPAELPWRLVDKAIRQNPPAETKGDLQELYRRLAGARGANLDFSKTPQPARGEDVDLAVYQLADGALRAGERLGGHAAPWLALLGVVAAAGCVAYVASPFVEAERWKRKLRRAAA